MAINLSKDNFHTLTVPLNHKLSKPHSEYLYIVSPWVAASRLQRMRESRVSFMVSPASVKFPGELHKAVL